MIVFSRSVGGLTTSAKLAKEEPCHCFDVIDIDMLGDGVSIVFWLTIHRGESGH